MHVHTVHVHADQISFLSFRKIVAVASQMDKALADFH